MTREDWLMAFTDRARPAFEAAGCPIPATVRCSIGFPSGRVRGKAIGECWADTATKDRVHEIFIHPTLADSAEIAGVLTHELVHAAVGLDAKHGPRFRKVAVALGLEGKMTATTVGEKWWEWATPVLAEIGVMPTGGFDAGESSRGKPQKNRHLLLVCNACGWQCRTTQSHIRHGLQCPDETCDGQLEQGQ